MRIFCCLFVFWVISLSQAAAQQPSRGGNSRPVARFGTLQRPVAADTTRPQADSLQTAVKDSLNGNSDLKEKVVYTDRDSTLMSADRQLVEMFGEAVVTYGEMEIRADYIRLNWKTGEVYAQQLRDSTSRKASMGHVIFKNAGETYNSDEIRYNFKTQRAAIRAVVTKQGEGNVRGRTVKKDSSNNFYLRNAFYTTCDLLHPHYGIASSKIKLAQGRGDYKQVISGPFNLVIAGVPMPLGLPFGFFPFSEKRQSGIIVGNYGEEPLNRGFYLRDFGYYWAASEHVGLRFTGQLYSRGSWGVGSQGSYIRRYRYSGSFSLQYNHNRTGDEIGPLKRISRDFSIQWSHAPQVLGRPYSFSASVNVASSSYLQNNEQNIYGSGSNLGRYQQNVFGSSVQYSRNFGDLVQTSVNVRINQNVSTKSVTAGVGVSVGVAQFQPFLRKNAITPLS